MPGFLPRPIDRHRVIDGGMSMQQAIEAPRFLVSRDPTDVSGRGRASGDRRSVPRSVVQDTRDAAIDSRRSDERVSCATALRRARSSTRSTDRLKGAPTRGVRHAAVRARVRLDLEPAVSQAARESRHLGDLARLPQVAPFVSGHRCERRPSGMRIHDASGERTHEPRQIDPFA
jgi:hypothetical protein